MRNSLLWKLLAINVPVIGAIVLVVWLTIDYLAADYFSALMKRYQISPESTHQMFLDAVHRYLIQATIGAVALAGFLSYLFTRLALRPLGQMTEITRRIAAGDYRARVDASSNDELGRLGEAFNRMTDSLEKVETLRKSMVSDLAHELRTPLTNIRGYLEALSDGVMPPSQETLDVLQQEVLRLVALVDDLQRLTQAEAARAYLERRDVDLVALIEQALKIDRQWFEARDISVDTNLDAAARTVAADADKLVQVLRNLTQNAWQHTPKGGALHVDLKRISDGVEVSFTNTGPTIAADEIPRLFERFYRPGGSRSRDSGGSGIGLAIVKELVEAHGGQVGAASGDGKTRFWFRLPG